MSSREGRLPLIHAKDLKKHFPVRDTFSGRQKGVIHAVNGIDFNIRQGETLGLVGESGSGKSTTGRLILRLLEPSSGAIFLEGQDISTISSKAFRRKRKDLQMVFQNPYAALDYKMTIEDILMQPLHIHHIVPPLEYRQEVGRLLELVGLAPADARKFPHEFSGGQRQRIGIARALATRPKFLVCDEPVSALDVSVQSQILNLVMDLQEEFGLTYLFITHDLNVIEHVSDEVAVMYLGKIVEKSSVDQLFSSPLHPYTQVLLSAVPGQRSRPGLKGISVIGEIPSPLVLPEGCAFYARCPYRMKICRGEEPSLTNIKDCLVACHLYPLE